MGEEARGVEKVLTAGPPQAQISVRILLPILCAVLAVELTALGFLGRVVERGFQEREIDRLPPAAVAALKSAHLHRSLPGMATAALLLVLAVVLCRKGVFDATGRWFCLALILGTVVYPVCFVAAIVEPMQRFGGGLNVFR